MILSVITKEELPVRIAYRIGRVKGWEQPSVKLRANGAQGRKGGEVAQLREGCAMESKGSIFAFSDTYETFSKGYTSYQMFS